MGPVHDIRARAWAVKGNALRLSADLRGATRCLNAALKLLEHGTGDPLEEARVCELFAVVRSNQRRIEQAVRLQERAMRLYRRAGHGDRLGKAMVDLASYNALAGDRQVAIELVTKALELIDAERDPHTALAGRHNLAVFLQEAGRRREALTVLTSARPLCEKLGDRSHVLRLRWLEGKLASEVGETKLAQDAYEEVYDGFVEYSPIDAALVSLDLALLYLENGRGAEVPAIMIAVETVFRSRESIATRWRPGSWCGKRWSDRSCTMLSSSTPLGCSSASAIGAEARIARGAGSDRYRPLPERACVCRGCLW